MHKAHVCKLNKDGKVEELEALSVEPVVFCIKCRAHSNDPRRLCNPRALK